MRLDNPVSGLSGQTRRLNSLNSRPRLQPTNYIIIKFSPLTHKGTAHKTEGALWTDRPAKTQELLRVTLASPTSTCGPRLAPPPRPHSAASLRSRLTRSSAPWSHVVASAATRWPRRGAGAGAPRYCRCCSRCRRWHRCCPGCLTGTRRRARKSPPKASPRAAARSRVARVARVDRDSTCARARPAVARQTRQQARPQRVVRDRVAPAGPLCVPAAQSASGGATCGSACRGQRTPPGCAR